MKQYVKFISDTEISYPVESDFPGVVNPLLHDGLMRRNGFFPLVGKPDEIEGKTLVLDRFLLRKASKTRTESFQKVVEDFEDDPNNPGHVIRTGEHTEWMNTEITLDDSYIRVTASHYEEIPAPEPPDTSERDNAERAIVWRIADLAIKYDAMADIAELELSIPSLLQLAERKGVTDADMQAVKADVAILVLDLMAKEGGTWQSCWDGLRSRFGQWMPELQ